jgi:hypothetical protein
MLDTMTRQRQALFFLAVGCACHCVLLVDLTKIIAHNLMGEHILIAPPMVGQTLLGMSLLSREHYPKNTIRVLHLLFNCTHYL